MRRAIVIKYGDAELSDAIADGIESNLPVPVKIGKHVRKPSTKLAVRAAMGFKDWKSLYYDAIIKYGDADDCYEPNIVAQKLLVGWAMLSLKVADCYKRLSDMNRR